MGEIKALTIFRQALQSGKISAADEAHLERQYGRSVKAAEGQNRNCVAAAARRLCGKPSDVPLSDISAHRDNWAPAFGPETFSPEYSGWWAFSLKVLYGDDWWDAVGKVWIAANALAAIERPQVIRLETKRGKSERKLDGRSPWIWGPSPFSQMPGPRFLWADPLNASTLIQRSISHPCLGLASGRGATITNWTHGNYGLPLAVLLDKKAQKPASWGTVQLDRGAVEHLPWLPALPPGTWFRYQWFDDGTKIVAMSHGRANTRGTVPLSVSRGDEVTYYTAAQDTGKGGTWTACSTELDEAGGEWRVKSQDRVLTVKMPGKPNLEVLWDAEGARVLGRPEPPDPDPRVKQALILIDQSIHGAPLEAQARTGAEVLRRILVNLRQAALDGAKTLVNNLKGAPKTSPPPPQDGRLTQALILIDQAVRGVPLEAQARTGAEVLRRILRGDGPGAHDGAKTLVSMLK